MERRERERTLTEVVPTIRGGLTGTELAILLEAAGISSQNYSNYVSRLVQYIRQPVSQQDIDALTYRVKSADKAAIVKTLIKAQQKAVREETSED